MPRPALNRPTDVECQILEQMWQANAPLSVAQLHAGLNKARKVAYSSVATITRIMVNKGWATLEDEKRPQTFAPAITREQYAGMVLDQVAKGAYGGSIAKAIRGALKGRSKKEVDAVRAELASL